MKVSYDGVLPTGHRLKGPPTLPDRGHPENTGLNNRTQNEDGSSACRPPYELAASKEGLATPVPYTMVLYSARIIPTRGIFVARS